MAILKRRVEKHFQEQNCPLKELSFHPIQFLQSFRDETLFDLVQCNINDQDKLIAEFFYSSI